MVEQAALAWLESLGWAVTAGPDIAAGEPKAERTDYGDVVLERRLRKALSRLNPGLPAEALEDAFPSTHTVGCRLSRRVQSSSA